MSGQFTSISYMTLVRKKASSVFTGLTINPLVKQAVTTLTTKPYSHCQKKPSRFFFHLQSIFPYFGSIHISPPQLEFMLLLTSLYIAKHIQTRTGVANGFHGTLITTWARIKILTGVYYSRCGITSSEPERNIKKENMLKYCTIFIIVLAGCAHISLPDRDHPLCEIPWEQRTDCISDAGCPDYFVCARRGQAVGRCTYIACCEPWRSGPRLLGESWCEHNYEEGLENVE